MYPTNSGANRQKTHSSWSRVETNIRSEDGFYSQFEVDVHAGLDDVASATGADSGAYKITIFVHSKEYDFARVTLVAQVLRNLYTTACAHGNVQDNKVRPEVFHFRTNRISIGNRADDLIVGLKHIGYVIEDSWIVVCH